MKSDRYAVILAVLLPLVLLLTTASPAFSQSPAIPGPEASSPRILILNSYHDGYSWSDNETTGIIETLKKSWEKPEVHIEYLDSKNFPNNEHFEQLQALYAVKYSQHRPMIVMTLDNPAFEFAVKYRQRLFSGIPIVFAGLNDYAPAMLQGEKGVTGIVEKQDIVGTIKLAHKLQPGLKEVVMLHDGTASGRASRKEAEAQLASVQSSVKLRYLPEMTIDEITATLAKLESGTIVLPFSFSRDKAGRIFTHSELAQILSKSSPVPVYGTKEERLGYGIIGGSLMAGKSHGSEAAELAVRVLRGESPDAIPVVLAPRSRLMFDYKQMRKFSISPDSLPSGSEVINRPVNFYRQNPTVYNSAIGIILVLSVALGSVIYTNRRKIAAEEALLEAERAKARLLEAANQEMESFLYAISHDLQAPLRHITSYSRILEDEYHDRLEGDGSRYLERITLASKKMTALINDILSLSRIGRAELLRTTFDLGALAADIFAGLQSLDSSRAVSMTVSPDMKITADKKLMTLVLDHLVGNAWKYTAKTERAKIVVGSKSANGRVIYFISDNGVGFDMQYAEKLFAPFQRLHPDSEFEGAGVGLATVQRVINRHGGQIWAESRPGEGATFYFTLEP